MGKVLLANDPSSQFANFIDMQSPGKWASGYVCGIIWLRSMRWKDTPPTLPLFEEPFHLDENYDLSPQAPVAVYPADGLSHTEPFLPMLLLSGILPWQQKAFKEAG